MTMILASTSPIRRAMLEAAGVAAEVVAPGVDEQQLKSGEPAEAALRLAVAKAETVSSQRPDAWVIGSDSIVSLHGRVLDKPADRAQAAEHLRAFSGREIILVSAVALASGGESHWSVADSARLKVRRLSEPFIQSYLDAEWPEVGYCVGVFRIEGRGVQLFESIDGSHFTILGMPLIPLLGALRTRGLIEA